MPLVTEHLRRNPKVLPEHESGWTVVEHKWSEILLIRMSDLIEEDGGPPMAFGSGYGELAHRPLVDHTFTQDYVLPNGEEGIRKGDRVRMWREQYGMRSPISD